MQYLSPEHADTGYEIGNEADQAMPVIDLDQLTMSVGDTPSEVIPNGFHVIEQQGRIGSCQGCALSSVMEGIAFLQTGRAVRISKMGAYRFSQLESDPPINGDRGSTLASGATAAKKGICKAEHWPYPKSYQRKIPKEAEANREDFKIRTAKRLKSEDPARAVVDWIGSGRGFAVMGIAWDSTTCDKPVIDSYRDRGGGHAISILGYSIQDSMLTIANSWGEGVYDAGYQSITFKAFNKMMKGKWNLTVLYSDLVFKEDQSRKIPDFSQIGKVCR